ncbi:hypothetical protein TCAL_09036 [Tigriopus californicus]|uniref:Nucleolar protein 12 n=1 Tax=Tigriopus californicus TaxID=6832 RepID=A0A553PPL0_TIGCA|nr:nucleolar protein 12-like [Tigriopus californicus]TRY79622.1 hypothetical protein TCAL_09036 [Tigriopus californicus]|eukprot:TCALIF_09036-PA protein Name:"Similar to nol12 Nucleolar protein 12 (Xenopus tropicalis)" AED:0.03 eAED:0.03 QI:33/1/1/1/1/1/3/297/221
MKNVGRKSSVAFDYAPKKEPAEKGGVGKRRVINRASKTSLVFDPEKRKEFLTGFRKRKDERRKKAKEQRELELKEEMKKAKEKARANINEAKSEEFNKKVKDDIQRFLPSEVTDFGTHTVSVTHVDSLVDVRENKISAQGEDQEESEEPGDVHQVKTKKEKKAIGRMFLKQVQESKAFKAAQRQQSKKESKANKFSRKKFGNSKRERHYHPKKEAAGKGKK